MPKFGVNYYLVAPIFGQNFIYKEVEAASLEEARYAAEADLKPDSMQSGFNTTYLPGGVIKIEHGKGFYVVPKEKPLCCYVYPVENR